MRLLTASLAVLLLLVPATRAGEEGVSGNWKVTIFEDGQQVSYWLILFENKMGKLGGSVEPIGKVPPTALSNVRAAGELLRFTLKLERGPVFEFEGKLPRAGGKKIYGSLARGAAMIPAVLEATPAKNGFELERDLVVRNPNDPRVFAAVLGLVAQAREHKVPAQDVQEWIETALRTADNFGPRWQQDVAVQLVEALLAQPDYAALAVSTAQQAVKLLDAQTPMDTQLRVLTSLADAFKQTGKLAQAKEVATRIDRLEQQAHGEYETKMSDFKVAKFAGRKGKSNRAILVELFTGAQCPPCVAADLAFDALPRAYDTQELVLLQYHLHVPGPDALTNADTEARAEYYGEAKIRGTPTVLFNGRVTPVGGGGREDAEDIYKEYRRAAEPLLEEAAAGQLQASAVRKEDKVHIKAKVMGLEKPGPKIKLRIALVEDWARYKGRNGLQYHHHVVRAFPGGSAGITVAEKNAEQTAVVDLPDLRKSLTKYLDSAAKEAPFIDNQRPMRLRDLSVVVFLQNDATQEVLNAVQVAVKDE